MYVAAVDFILLNSSVKSNTAVQGGAFSLDTEAEAHLSVEVKDNVFEMNSAQTYGGVFYIQPSLAPSTGTKVLITGNLTNNQFTSNYVHLEKGGGILWLNNSILSHLNISNSIIHVHNSSCFCLMDPFHAFNSQEVLLSNFSFYIESLTNKQSHATLISLASISDNLKASRYKLQNVSFQFKNTYDLSLESENQLSLLSAVNSSLTLSRIDIIGIHSSKSLIQLTDTDALITNSLLERNRLNGASGMSVISAVQSNRKLERNLSLSNLEFRKNTGSEMGGVLKSDKVSVYISNCSFSDNNAMNFGGALALIDSPSTIIESSCFISNSVADFSAITNGGGALYYKNVLSHPHFLVKSCNFTENRAVKGQGGAVLLNVPHDYGQESIKFSISDNHFEKNVALFGDSVSTGAIKLQMDIFAAGLYEPLTKLYAPDRYLLPRKMMGQDFEDYMFNFSLLDYFNNTINQKSNYNNLTLRFDIVQNDRVVDYNSCTSGLCTLKGDSIVLKGQANDTQELKILAVKEGETVFSFTLQVELRECVAGEINRTKEEICDKCPQGRYSFNPTDTGCMICPSEGVECLGGSVMRVKEGYWRPHNRSDHIYKCQKGGISCIASENNTCNAESGYTGPICLGCDIEKGFFRKSSGLCARCSKPWLGILIAIAYNLIFFAIEFIFVNRMHRKNKDLIDNGTLNEEAIPRLFSGRYLSVFLLYFQIFAVIKSLSSFVVDVIHTFSPEVNPSQTLFYSLDCALRSFGVSVDNVYYWKVGFIGSVPFFKILLLVLYSFVKKRFSPDFHSKSFIIAVVLNIVIFEQPGVLQNMISLLICQNSDPDASDQSHVMQFVRDSPNVQCGTGLYNTFYYFVAILSIIFWVLLIPLAYSLLLWKNSYQLREEKFARYCGTLYIVYEPQYFLWGIVEMGLKILITLASQFDTGGGASRGFTIN